MTEVVILAPEKLVGLYFIFWLTLIMNISIDIYLIYDLLNRKY